MKVSVVTATYNSAKTLGYTIDSFLEQSWTDAEMLVIDGVSKDDTVALAERYGDPRIRVFSEPDKGIYDAFNKGLQRFSGDAVGYLGSDDRFHDQTALAAIAGALETHDIVHGNLDFVADHETKKIMRRWRARPWRPGAFQRGWMAAHPTFYVRRSVVERVGLFNCDYSIAADYDFMVRAIAAEGADVRVGLIDQTLVDMMMGGTSTTGIGAYIRNNLESLDSRRRWLGASRIDWALFAKPLGKATQWLVR